MRLPDGEELDVRLPLLGRQNVANALAAAAAAEAVGVSSDDIVTGLGRATAVRGRLQSLEGRGGATLVDDSYNANPGSVRGGSRRSSPRSAARECLVLGDMAELGAEARVAAREIGELRARSRAMRCSRSVELAARGGRRLTARARRQFHDMPVRARRDRAAAGADDDVLVKASRVMGLDRRREGARGRSDERHGRSGTRNGTDATGKCCYAQARCRSPSQSTCEYYTGFNVFSYLTMRAILARSRRSCFRSRSARR